ncbi:MAG: preprotein translocase subunit SecE [Terracidiphilus sp.]|jgi:preprotein translocase subunit SecE
MASKAALANGEERPSSGKLTPAKRPNAEPNALERVTNSWKEFTHFLSDVRGEMRKVVTPSRKEVEATTTVVIVAVFIFGLFFFIVDSIFAYGLDRLLKQLGGVQ